MSDRQAGRAVWAASKWIWKALKALWRALKWLWSSPVLGAVEAALAILAGLVGAVFADELKSWASGLTIWRHGDAAFPTLPGGARLFWELLAITSVLHIARAAASQFHQRKTQRKFELAAAKIEDAVATNASPDYLSEFGLTFEKSHTVFSAASNPEQCRRAIQLILKAIAKLASVYDSRKDPTAKPDFVANVMWYIPSEKAQQWDQHVAFRATGTTLEGVRGVLAMPSAFSVATSREDNKHGLPNFALDVPLKIGSQDGGWSVLPGAPFCFVKKDFEHFHPAKDIEGWMVKYGDFSPSVAKAVGAYFRGDPSIAGFMSLPVLIPTSDFKEQADREAIGVLNVHWSAADILDHARAAQKFGHTIYPLRVLLSKLMLKVNEEGHPSPSPAPAPA